MAPVVRAVGGLAQVGSGSDHATSLRSGLALSGASSGLGSTWIFP